MLSFIESMLWATADAVVPFAKQGPRLVFAMSSRKSS